MKFNLSKIWILLIVGFTLFTACEDDMSSITSQEAFKDITGSWQVIQLKRNGEDLSERMNLHDFRMDFKEDGTYSLAEKLPFLTQGTGNYELNDPQYPFSLILTSEQQESHTVKFQFPVVDGRRQLSLTFSLGCTSNSYEYNFERVNQDQ